MKTMKMIEATTEDQQCLTKRETQINRVHIAIANPVRDGILLGKVEGHYSRIMGEVIYVISCPPVPAYPRVTDECFQELPVIIDKKEVFLTPITRVVTDLGTPVACTPTLTPRFL